MAKRIKNVEKYFAIQNKTNGLYASNEPSLSVLWTADITKAQIFDDYDYAAVGCEESLIQRRLDTFKAYACMANGLSLEVCKKLATNEVVEAIYINAK